MAGQPNLSKIEPTESMKKEAKQNPNGWVYAIEGSYGPNDAVPPEAIAGGVESRRIGKHHKRKFHSKSKVQIKAVSSVASNMAFERDAPKAARPSTLR